MSYAARFAQNAKELTKRDIVTTEIESTCRVPELERSCVFYKLLQGETVRDYIETIDPGEVSSLMEKLGGYIALLHNKGVLFRSLHLGNILVTEDGGFGLIDISDMSFNRGSLMLFQRIRNFRHMDRHPSDRVALASNGCKSFIQSYLKVSKLSGNAAQKLSDAFKSRFAQYAP